MENREIFSAITTLPPVFVRLDGRAFHRLAENLALKKPFDDRFSDAMVRVCTALVADSGLCPDFAFTFSDEISLYFTQLPFNGRVEKIDSVSASCVEAQDCAGHVWSGDSTATRVASVRGAGRVLESEGIPSDQVTVAGGVHVRSGRMMLLGLCGVSGRVVGGGADRPRSPRPTCGPGPRRRRSSAARSSCWARSSSVGRRGSGWPCGCPGISAQAPRRWLLPRWRYPRLSWGRSCCSCSVSTTRRECRTLWPQPSLAHRLC